MMKMREMTRKMRNERLSLIHARLKVETGHTKCRLDETSRKQESPDIRHQVRAGDTTIAAAPSRKSISSDS